MGRASAAQESLARLAAVPPLGAGERRGAHGALWHGELAGDLPMISGDPTRHLRAGFAFGLLSVDLLFPLHAYRTSCADKPGFSVALGADRVGPLPIADGRLPPYLPPVGFGFGLDPDDNDRVGLLQLTAASSVVGAVDGKRQKWLPVRLCLLGLLLPALPPLLLLLLLRLGGSARRRDVFGLLALRSSPQRPSHLAAFRFPLFLFVRFVLRSFAAAVVLRSFVAAARFIGVRYRRRRWRGGGALLNLLELRPLLGVLFDLLLHLVEVDRQQGRR